MKKLCTYLTLFVLSLLCFAQPAAAAEALVANQTYYVDVSSCTWFKNDGASLQIYIPGQGDVNATKIDTDFYSFVPTVSIASNVYFKRMVNGSKTNEFQFTGLTHAGDNLITVNNNYNGYQTSVYTVPGTSTFDPAKTYYLDGHNCDWVKNDGIVFAFSTNNGSTWTAMEKVTDPDFPGYIYKFQVPSAGLTSIKCCRMNSDGHHNQFTLNAPADENVNCYVTSHQFDNSTNNSDASKNAKWTSYTEPFSGPSVTPDPLPGTFPGPIDVLLTPSQTDGIQLFYTTDGSEPNAALGEAGNTTKILDPNAEGKRIVHIEESTTLKVRIFWGGSWLNETQTFKYTIASATDYIFYLDKGNTGWGDNIWAYLFKDTDNPSNSWNTDTNGTYIKGTKLKDGKFKFVVPGQMSKGCLLFKTNNSDHTWGNNIQTEDIKVDEVQNGRLYVLKHDDDNKEKPSFRDNYSEPSNDPKTYTFYLDCTQEIGWNSPMLRAYNKGDYEWTNPNWYSGTKVADGIFKYTIPDQLTTGVMLFAKTREAAAQQGLSSSEIANDQIFDGACYVMNQNDMGFTIVKDYVVPAQKPVVTCNWASRDFQEKLEIALNSVPGDAYVYYTLDGSDPRTSETRVWAQLPFIITQTTTVKAYAEKDGVKGDVRTWTFTLIDPTRPDYQLYVIGKMNDWKVFEKMNWDAATGEWYYNLKKGEFKIVDGSYTSADGNIAWDQANHSNEYTIIGNNKTVPANKTTGANFEKSYSGDNLSLPYDAVLRINKDCTKIWYSTSGSPVYDNVYIAGQFITAGNDWGQTFKEMTWDRTAKAWIYKASAAGQFMIGFDNSSVDQFWNKSNNLKPVSGASLIIPSARPTKANVTKGQQSGNFSIAKAGTIYFDPDSNRLWYEADENNETNNFAYINGYFVDRTDKVWYDTENVKQMKYDEEREAFYFDAYRMGRFNLSELPGAQFWSSVHQGLEIDTESTFENAYTIPEGEPESSNLSSEHINLTDGNKDDNFLIMPEAGRIWFKKEDKGHKVWYETIDLSWDDYDFDVYVRGMLFFGVWANEERQDTPDPETHTIKMNRVPGYPGLWTLPISKEKVEVVLANGTTTEMETWHDDHFTTDISSVDVDERFHFNFSILRDDSDGSGSKASGNNWWHNAVHPADGIAVLDGDGTPTPFLNGPRTSQNFVYTGVGDLYVDMAHGLVWIQAPQDYSTRVAKFYFWDKGGDAYPQDVYKWWNKSSNRYCEVFIPGTSIKETETPIISQAGRVENNKSAGYQYEINCALPESFLVTREGISEAEMEKNGYKTTVINGTEYILETYTDNYGNPVYEADGVTPARREKVKDNIRVRIANNVNFSGAIERPYVRDAVYTQGPVDDPAFNDIYTGDFKVYAAEYVNFDVAWETIDANIEADFHRGKAENDLIVKYDKITSFTTAVNVGDANTFPFTLEPKIQPDWQEKEVDGEIVKYFNGGHYSADIAPENRFFKKRNQMTVSHGQYKESKIGSTGRGFISGMDFVNTSAQDNLTVEVTYDSPGMIIRRVVSWNLDDETADMWLPSMKPSEDNAVNLEPVFEGFIGGACSDSKYSLDLLVSQKFDFRDESLLKFPGYVGYHILNVNTGEETSAQADHSVAEGNEQVAEGAPLCWVPGWAQNAEAFSTPHDKDNWASEAYKNKQLNLHFHHLLCANNAAELETKRKQTTIDVCYHLVIPVATDIRFLTGSEAKAAEERVEKFKEEIKGGNNPAMAPRRRAAGARASVYTGSVSVGNHDDDGALSEQNKFTRTLSLDGNNFIVTGLDNILANDDANAPVEFYNLQGMRVAEDALTPGIYIRRQGKTAEKVYIR
ncbi:MAG: chitobiase/beta-hexosaminidase C-terminal domain-containing protein [Muribaculaceae bacterium]|nr:chitobiase/beta-hexosaminidase C-terminal domain-containing protein [Muribaculaceae bacterium]